MITGRSTLSELIPLLPHSITVWTNQPGPCTRCQVMHYLFVCRGGRTVCADCDAQERTEGAC